MYICMYVCMYVCDIIVFGFPNSQRSTYKVNTSTRLKQKKILFTNHAKLENFFSNVDRK